MHAIAVVQQLSTAANRPVGSTGVVEQVLEKLEDLGLGLLGILAALQLCFHRCHLPARTCECTFGFGGFVLDRHAHAG